MPNPMMEGDEAGEEEGEVNEEELIENAEIEGQPY